MRGGVGLVLFAVATAVALWFWLRGPKKPPAPATVAAPSAVHVRGFVRASGQPVAGAVVKVYGYSVRTTTAGGDGAFDFGVLPRSDLRFDATASRMNDAHVQVSYRDVGAPIQITMTPCRNLLRGRVRDADGTKLRATIHDPNQRSMSTDDDGGFELCLQYGSGLHVAADGYLPRWVTADRSDTPLDVVLERGGVIAGRVLRTDRDEPISGAAVLAPQLRATTANDGSFQLRGLQPGRYALFARGDGWESPSVDVAVTKGATTTITLRAEPTFALRGLVVYGGGAPVARATVCLDAAAELCTSTDGDGRFVLRTMGRGEHRIGVAGRFVSPTRVTVSPRAPEVVLRVKPMNAFATVRGRVMRLGTPIAGAVVNDAVPTAADGSYEIRLPPGTNTIAAYSRDLFARGGPVTITVAHRETRDLDLELDQEAAIGGVIVDQDGAPVPRVAVFVRDEAGADAASVRTRADGSFYIAPLASGVYRAQVLPTMDTVNSFRDTVRDPVRVGTSDTQVTGLRLVVDTRVGTIAGRVEDADGRPVAGVRAWVADQPGGWEPPPTTGPDGRFTLRGVPLGTHTVVAGDGSRWGATADVETARDDVVVTIAGAITLEGTVTGLGSAPTVTLQAGGVRTIRAVGGSFRFEDLPAGDLTIAAFADGVATLQTLRVLPPLTRVALRAGEKPTLVVRVTDDGGAPAPDVECELLGWWGGVYREPRLPVGPEGTIAISGVEGRVNVRCRSRGYARFWGESGSYAMAGGATQELVIPVLLGEQRYY